VAADANEPDPPLGDQSARESLARTQQLGDLANSEVTFDC
jgi:hypothetical protein